MNWPIAVLLLGFATIILVVPTLTQTAAALIAAGFHLVVGVLNRIGVQVPAWLTRLAQSAAVIMLVLRILAGIIVGVTLVLLWAFYFHNHAFLAVAFFLMGLGWYLLFRLGNVFGLSWGGTTAAALFFAAMVMVAAPQLAYATVSPFGFLVLCFLMILNIRGRMLGRRTQNAIKYISLGAGGLLVWAVFQGVSLGAASSHVTNMYLLYPPITIGIIWTLFWGSMPFLRRSAGQVVTSAALVLAYWGAAGIYIQKGEPGYLWTQRFIHFQFGRLHSVNTVQAKTETEGVVAGAEQAGKVPDISVVRASFDPSAKRARGIDNEQRAWDDEASGRATNYESQVVEGYLNGWRDKFVQHRPTLVIFGHEEICSGWNPNECTTALGSDKADSSYTTVIQDDTEGGTKGGPAGRYRAVIARVRSDGGTVTKPIETGFTVVICAFGTTQLRTNVRTWYGPAKTSQDTAGNSNGITFRKYVGDPLAIATCNAHPGSAIIPIDEALVGNR